MELGFTPDWSLPSHVQAFMTVRAGGVSRAPFDSLNLGDHVGDDPSAVAENRSRLCARLGIQTAFLRQVHGEAVQHLTASNVESPDLVADIALSTAPRVAATIMVADCLPLLFAHQRLPVVAAAHAGWRGLAGAGTQRGADGVGVIAQTMNAIAATTGQSLSDAARELTVWLGPAIGPDAFEVGDDVRSAFLTQTPCDDDAFVPRSIPGKYLADLPLIARRKLRALGVSTICGNDSSVAWCTVSQADRYFSHRRDQNSGGSGRLAALIWLK
ncbi:MAG: peptidoglycan editing factor PgeF [Burkholderiaceae bacterium]